MPSAPAPDSDPASRPPVPDARHQADDWQLESKPTPFEWRMRPDMLQEPLPRTRSRPRVFCLADVPPAPQQWVWRGRIPRGALTLLCGDPGQGKSLLTLDVAARVSAGLPCPAGSPTEAGDVLLFAAEDAMARTVRNRLAVHGADLQRVHYVSFHGAGGTPSIAPPDHSTVTVCSPFGELPFQAGRALTWDLRQLSLALEALPDCRLVVVDPLPAYLSMQTGVDDYHDVFRPLMLLAEASNVAVVVVADRPPRAAARDARRPHPLLTLAAVARTVYLLDRTPHAPRARRLLPLKSNFGDATTAPVFTVVAGPQDQPLVRWLADVPLAGDDGDPIPARRVRHARLDRAVAWLQGALAAGPALGADVTRRALELRFSEMTLRRARQRLGVQAVRQSRTAGGRWLWLLPSSPGTTYQVDQKTPLNDMNNLSALVAYEPPP